jgi:hypothetical protein
MVFHRFSKTLELKFSEPHGHNYLVRGSLHLTSYKTQGAFSPLGKGPSSFQGVVIVASFSSLEAVSLPYFLKFIAAANERTSAEWEDQRPFVSLLFVISLLP